MREIVIENKFYRYILGVDDDDQLFHVCFLPKSCEKSIDIKKWRNRCEKTFSFEALVNINFEPLQLSHGVRYFYSLCSKRARFKCHNVYPIKGGYKHIITLTDAEGEVNIHLYYEVFDNSPAIRRYTEVENFGMGNVIINHLSSYVLSNFPYFDGDCTSTYLHYFKSHWSFEGQPNRESFADLGIYDHNCRNGFTIESSGTWVCQEYFPYFVIEQSDCNLFTAVQQEYSSSWRFEAGAFDLGVDNWYYIQGGLGNDMHAHWYKTLAPKERFTSPPASITVAEDLELAFNQMHIHQQEVLIKRSSADMSMPVIYNDWPFMQADVTEEKIIVQLETLSKCGVELYVIDAGWFTSIRKDDPKNSWWDYAGHWEYDRKRFPHGLEYVVKKIKEHGMKAGIWCEIEAVGKEAEIYNDKEMLLTRDGFFVSDANRRFLNFNSEKGRNYANQVIDNIVQWGFEYIKIDYNIDSAPGCNSNGEESIGLGLHNNRMAYYRWLEDVRLKYPFLIIENCSSGGMRLEYGMLSRSDLSSITDQADYKLIGGILYNVSKLIHPSQCGTWSWLEDGFSLSDFEFALTNSMLARMHISGNMLTLTKEKLDTLITSVNLYKSYRHILPKASVYHHSEDFKYHFNNKIRVLEIRSQENDLSVFCIQRPDCQESKMTIYPKNLKKGVYHIDYFPAGPSEKITDLELKSKGLTVDLPHKFSAKVVILHKEK